MLVWLVYISAGQYFARWEKSSLWKEKGKDKVKGPFSRISLFICRVQRPRTDNLPGNVFSLVSDEPKIEGLA
jgi:hypothetical protein